MLEEHEAEFLDALRTDLGKPAVEGFVSDIAFVTTEVRSMIRHLARWNRPRRVSSPWSPCRPGHGWSPSHWAWCW